MHRTLLLYGGLCLATVTCASAQIPDFPALPSIYAHYSAGNPANVTVAPLNQTFTATEVDVVNRKLNLPDLGFAAIAYPNGIGPATPVYFTSTGTLPAPLAPGVPYYIVPAAGGGYAVFAVATDADASLQPGAVPGEKVLPAQNVSQGVGAVQFSNGGTGTHTLSTKLLLSQLTDLTANGFHSVAQKANDKHHFLEVDTDAAGHKFIHTGGATARENMIGNYNAYGQTFVQSPGSKAFEARQKIGGQRVVYQVYVGRVRSFKERQVTRFLAAPGNIDASSGQITYTTHRMNTGDLINLRAYPGSSLPAPLAEGTDYFARRIDANKLTIHASAADATAGTGALTYTNSGVGNFLFYAPQRVGDARRWSFFAEVLEPNGGGNTLSPRLQEPVPSAASIVKLGTAFTVSGSGNGNIAGFASLPDLTPVVLWTPPRATLPAPLQAGTRYWTTKTPGSSSVGRLHATLASAQESVGVASAASSCIKYSAVGSGEMLVSHDDDATGIAYGTLGPLENMGTRVPLGPLCVLVFKIDFNDPAAASVLATLGLNEAVTETKLLNIPKGLTPAAVNDGSRAWTLFNSAQGHVPIDLDLYEMIMGSSTEAVANEDLQRLVDYCKAKYGIGPRLDLGAVAPEAEELGPVPGVFRLTQTGGQPLPVSYSVSGSASAGQRYTALPGTAQVPAAGDSAEVQVKPLGNALYDGPQAVVMTLAPSAAYARGGTGSAVVTIRDRPAEEWKFGRFGASANDPGVGGDEVMHNGAGLPNLLAYALGADPRNAGPADLPRLITGGGIALRFTRNPAARDLTYGVQASSDLEAWESLSTYRENGGWDPPGLVEESAVGPLLSVSVQDPLSPAHGQRYLRLLVTQ